MKRFVTMLLIVAIILSLSACKRAEYTSKNLVLQPGAGNSELPQKSSEGQTGSDVDEQETVQTGDATPEVLQGDGTDGDAGNGDIKLECHTSSDYCYVLFDKLYEKADLIMICRYDGKTKQVEPNETSPDGYANYVYTDQYVTPIKTAKGSAGDSVPIRFMGGVKIDFVYSFNDPLQKGNTIYCF